VQTLVSLLTVITGELTTVIVMLSFAVQPPPPVVATYLVVTKGVATGLAQLLQLNPVDGFHVMFPFATAFNCTALPAQTVVSLPATVNVGLLAIKMVIVSEPLPQLAPVIVAM
jgi:hypothetical protein